MAKWKITPADDKTTTEYFTFKKDSMTITAEHYATSVVVVVDDVTQPEITVGPEGYDFVSLFNNPNITVDSAEIVKPYDYHIIFDIENETDHKTWKDFLRDEHGGVALNRIHLLESEGWTKTYSLITKSQLTIEEVI